MTTSSRPPDHLPSAEPLSVEEALAALRFQMDMGADEALEPAPQKLAGAAEVGPAVGRRAPSPPSDPTPAPGFTSTRAAPPASPTIHTSVASTSLAPVSLASASLAQVQTLEDLRAALAHLTGLSVKETAMNLVFGEGALAPPVMVVGEAPGEEEDRTGRPFVGAAGRLLDKMLAAIGVSREQAYITNVLNWRPPGNRTPKPEEVATCLPYLMRHVELVKPAHLLLVGGPAAQALLARTDSVTRLRGQWWAYHSPGLSAPIPALVTYHPAYLLRTPAQKRESWRDLLLLKKKMSQS